MCNWIVVLFPELCPVFTNFSLHAPIPFLVILFWLKKQLRFFRSSVIQVSLHALLWELLKWNCAENIFATESVSESESEIVSQIMTTKYAIKHCHIITHKYLRALWWYFIARELTNIRSLQGRMHLFGGKSSRCFDALFAHSFNTIFIYFPLLDVRCLFTRPVDEFILY